MADLSSLPSLFPLIYLECLFESQISKKTNVELSYYPTIPLVGIYLEKTIIWKEMCTPVFTAALFIITKTWKQPKCPLTDEQIKGMCYINTMEYYSTIKKNDVICSNMDGPRDYHAKWSKSTKRDKYRMMSLICGIWKKKKRYKWIYLQNRYRFTDIENKLMVTKGEEESVSRSVKPNSLQLHGL